MPKWIKYARYFAGPFPKARGFSPYRSPGLSVHLPFWGMMIGDGLYWCLPETWLLPLLAVYVAAGLYLGRDVAILAHYNFFITLSVIGGMFFLIFWGPGRMIGFDAFREFYGPGYVPLSILNTILVVFLFRRSILALTPEQDDDQERD